MSQLVDVDVKNLLFPLEASATALKCSTLLL